MINDSWPLEAHDGKYLFLDAVSTQVEVQIRWIDRGVFHADEELAIFTLGNEASFEDRGSSVFLDMEYSHYNL